MNARHVAAVVVLTVRAALAEPSHGEPPNRFDIVPFALPNSPPGEYWFEEPRDIAMLVVRFRQAAPRQLGVSYLRKTWPQARVETAREVEDPCAFGWMPIDDGFTGQWHDAAVDVQRANRRTLTVTFKGLAVEFPEAADYDVHFRRTLGLRIRAPGAQEIEGVRIFTTSPPAASRLRVELDAGQRTPGMRIRLTGYNAAITGITGVKGVRAADGAVELLPVPERSFELDVAHMEAAHPHSGDEAHLTFRQDADTFTVSLGRLQREGPIWYEAQGIYIAFARDATGFRQYRQRISGQKTLDQRVPERREQTYAGACNGQPRPHPVSTNIGCKLNRQRFRLESNGDLVLHKWNVTSIPSEDTARFKCDGDARFFFGLERKAMLARFTDDPPVPVWNVLVREAGVTVEQKSVAVPLEGSILDEPLAGDATVVALLRFRFQNLGDGVETAELSVGYSHRSGRSQNAYAGEEQDDALVPRGERDTLLVDGDVLRSRWHDASVVRAGWNSTMRAEASGPRVSFRQDLRPGEQCELQLKVPFIAIDRPAELSALRALDFDRCHREATQFWRQEAARGAQLICPEPHLTSLHAAHLIHVLITDAAMPDGSGLINTSVGTSTYGNFSNEACMVVHELDQRGLHDEARRRLDVWVKYQGMVPQPGNFTDYEGMYFGAGGFEEGAYNQHHGWVLWCMAMHYFLSGDRAWLARTAPSLIAGCDWVFRQRSQTMASLPHSRGWERGFLPAGSLEDVTDFHYWLSTNALTWRGVDCAARALAALGHPEAARLQSEAAAYGADLRRGFQTMRHHTPLVRLRDGRWVPHDPSRLYWRGRDIGWIREVLEGSVYLLLSGLVKVSEPQAQWILDDYQDNRYVSPPYGYPMLNFEHDWFDRGGFSIQPNLLAGLLPHLDRDEPEAFLRMFFNAWCACYREEIDAMVEQANPELGYSTAAHFKTSDESNAVSWLRAMFVYANDTVLHLGRALPREWFASGKPIETTGVATQYGTVDLGYETSDDRKVMTATLDLRLRVPPPAVLVRFRHPDGLPLRAVRVNGKPWTRFDATRNDVDVTACSGAMVVQAEF